MREVTGSKPLQDRFGNYDFSTFLDIHIAILIWGFTCLTNADVEALIETWHIQLLFQGKISTNFKYESKIYFMNVPPTFWKKIMNESMVMWQQHLTVTQRFQVRIQMISTQKISQKLFVQNIFFKPFMHLWIIFNDILDSKVLGNLLTITLRFWTVW